MPHEKCGKLIVATDASEIPRLEKLFQAGGANGVEGLTMVDRAFITKREPNIRAVAGIFSPDTGIVEAEALVHALRRAGEAEGAIFLPGTKFLSGDPAPDGIQLRTERETILAPTVVNAAGLYADEVSQMLGGDEFRIYPVRGEYAVRNINRTLGAMLSGEVARRLFGGHWQSDREQPDNALWTTLEVNSEVRIFPAISTPRRIRSVKTSM